MGKKSVNRKAVQRFIVDARENGKTDQEIYYELAEQYYDKKSIAIWITATPTKENKNKYKVYNNILLALLGLSILYRIMLVINLTIISGNLLALLLILIVPAFAAYFAFEIARYTASAYRFCGIMAIVGFTQSVGKIEGGSNTLITLAFAGAVAVLSFYLDSKLFPKYSPQNMKKDGGGNYILD